MKMRFFNNEKSQPLKTQRNKEMMLSIMMGFDSPWYYLISNDSFFCYNNHFKDTRCASEYIYTTAFFFKENIY